MLEKVIAAVICTGVKINNAYCKYLTNSTKYLGRIFQREDASKSGKECSCAIYECTQSRQACNSHASFKTFKNRLEAIEYRLFASNLESYPRDESFE